jgi:hypothetical protein
MICKNGSIAAFNGWKLIVVVADQNKSLPQKVLRRAANTNRLRHRVNWTSSKRKVCAMRPMAKPIQIIAIAITR